MVKNIEKAHNVGDVHPSGKWVWTEIKPGKFDWRKPAGGVSKKEEPKKKDDTPKQSTPDSKGGNDSTTTTTTTTATTTAPKKSSYDAPKPKVAYNNKPEIPYEVPEGWYIRNKKGQRERQERSDWRKRFSDKKVFTDDKLIDIVNRTSMNNPYLRHMAWEEAAARGIPESKLNVSGTLQNFWDDFVEKYKQAHPEESDDIEDMFGTAYRSNIGDFDVEKFRLEFPNGDDGWKNPDDPRVRKAFNNMISLKNRQQYDALVDLWKREDPYYEGVKDQLANLNVQLASFLESKYQNGSAMFISTGGAGAGKTTALTKVIDSLGMHLYDPEKDSDPTAGNIDVVKVDKDIDTDKDFFELLNRYNGKVIVFDDKDKALVSSANKIISAMKNVADGSYKERLIPGPSGKPTLFTGKLIFITNKSLDELNSDEDHKAILSRADKNDIKFTLNENLEVLGDRYKTMGGPMEGFTKQEEQDFRQKVYDAIQNNIEKIDPFKFTVRKFTELLRGVAAVKNAKEKSEKNAEFEELFGGAKSNSLSWQRAVIRNLNKGVDIDIEKAHSSEVFAKIDPKTLVKFKKMYKKDPDGFRELYGDKFIDFLNDENESDAEGEVEKAMISDLNDMSLEDAENLLFG